MNLLKEYIFIIETKNIDDFINYHNENKEQINLFENEDELFYKACIHQKLDIAKYIYNERNNKELLFNINCLLFEIISKKNIEIFQYLLELKKTFEKNIYYDDFLIECSINNSNDILEYLLNIDDFHIHSYMNVYIQLINIDNNELFTKFKSKKEEPCIDNLIEYNIFHQEIFYKNISELIIGPHSKEYIEDILQTLLLSSKQEQVKTESINNILYEVFKNNIDTVKNIDIIKSLTSLLDKTTLDNNVGGYIIANMYQNNIDILDYLFHLGIHHKYSFIENIEMKSKYEYKSNVEYILFDFEQPIFEYFYDYLEEGIQSYVIFLKAIKHRKHYLLKHIHVDDKLVKINEIKNTILITLYGTTSIVSNGDLTYFYNNCINMTGNNYFKMIQYLLEKYEGFHKEYTFIFKSMILDFELYNKENITYYLTYLNKKIPKKYYDEITNLMELYVKNMLLVHCSSSHFELLNYLEENVKCINFKKINKIRNDIVNNNHSNLSSSYINEYVKHNPIQFNQDIVYNHIFQKHNLDNLYKLQYIEKCDFKIEKGHLVKEFIKNNITVQSLIVNNNYEAVFIENLIKNEYLDFKYDDMNHNMIHNILLKGDIDKLRILMRINQIENKIKDYLEKEEYNDSCEELFTNLLKKDNIDNLNFYMEYKKNIKLKKFTTLIIRNIYYNNNVYLLKKNYNNLLEKKNDKILVSFLNTILKKCVLNMNYTIFDWCLDKIEQLNKIEDNSQLEEICHNIIEKWFKYSDDIDVKINIIRRMITYFNDYDKTMLTSNLIDKMCDNIYYYKILDFKDIIINLFDNKKRADLLNIIIEKTNLDYIKHYIDQIYKNEEIQSYDIIDIKPLLIGFSQDKFDYFQTKIINFKEKITSTLLYDIINTIYSENIERNVLEDLFKAIYQFDNDHFKDKFDNTLFKLCCYFGNKECVKFILEVNKDINVSDNNEEAFKNACDSGQLQIVKYLLYINNNIDISNNDEEAMFIACSNGHLNIAKFLYKIKPSINLGVKEDYIFSEVCNSGFMNMAKWLYSVIGNNLSHVSRHEHSICGACYYGHLEMAKWLYTTFEDIDITVDNDYCFISACKEQYIDMCYWIQELLPERYSFEYDDDDDDEPIKSFDINKILEINESMASEKPIEECFICYENQTNVISSCNHQYCFTCIEILFKRNSSLSCPYCRAENIKLYNIQ